MTVREADHQLIDRLNDLESRGTALASAARLSGGRDVVPAAPFNEWRSRCLQLLESFLGERSTQAQDFREQMEYRFRENVEAGIGILRAVHHDLAS